MPLIQRKRRVNVTWAMQAAEAGSMARVGISPEKIAKELDLGLVYVATLIDLYRGYKQFPKLLNCQSIHKAKVLLAQFRHEHMLKQLGELS